MLIGSKVFFIPASGFLTLLIVFVLFMFLPCEIFYLMFFKKDMDRCVTLFKAQPDNKTQPWVYIGKQRAHYKEIVGMKEQYIASHYIVLHFIALN